MRRIPNPFVGGEMQPKQPQTPSSPGFLMMTRPPSGSNSYGWRGGNRGGPFTPSQRHSLSPSDSFIPFSATGSNNNQDSSRRGRGGRYSQSGGGRGGQGSPRMYSPYQHTPSRGSGEWSIGGSAAHHQGGQFTPTRPNGNRDSFGNMRQNRFSFNGSPRGGRDRGPISDIPVEKFVSPSMVKDPWAEFDVPTTVPTPDPLRRTSTVPLLDDSEIVIDSDTSVVVIDSDTSVVVENSFEGGVSGTEGDSLPVPDAGSDSPSVATSSSSD